jgi:IS5 family transposase
MRLRMTARGLRMCSMTASDVWADTAYRSAKNEDLLAKRGFVSRIHRKKPPKGGRCRSTRTLPTHASERSVPGSSTC